MLGLLLLILWPVAELFVAIEVARAIGVLAMIVLLIAGWPVGAWALRSQGRTALRHLSEAVAAGRPPGREVIDGSLVLLGGFLLMVPGFITDVIAVPLLLPTRRLVRGLLVRNLRSRVVRTAIRFGRPRSYEHPGRGGEHQRGPRSYDVDSTAHDLDQPRLRQ